MNNLILNYEYTRGELCAVLGEEEEQGRRWYSQQARWKQMFEFYCIGTTRDRKYVITRILPPISTVTIYEVNGKTFNTYEEADKYRREVIDND